MAQGYKVEVNKTKGKAQNTSYVILCQDLCVKGVKHLKP